MPSSTRLAVLVVATSLLGIVGAYFLFLPERGTDNVSEKEQKSINSALQPFVARPIEVNTVPLLVAEEPVFLPPAVEQEEVLLEDQQALGLAMKAFLARVVSQEVREKAAARLNEISPPSGEDLVAIKAAKEIDEDKSIRAIQRKVADSFALESYYRDKISDAYYLNGEISWEEYVAATWLNAERGCQASAAQLDSAEFNAYLGVRSEAECIQSMRGIFTPPHPSEIFVRFPDILQYRADGRKYAIATEAELAELVPLVLVHEVLKMDNEIARRKSELPTTISPEERVRLASMLTNEFELRSRSMLGAKGYAILFGLDTKD